MSQLELDTQGAVKIQLLYNMRRITHIQIEQLSFDKLIWLIIFSFIQLFCDISYSANSQVTKCVLLHTINNFVENWVQFPAHQYFKGNSVNKCFGIYRLTLTSSKNNSLDTLPLPSTYVFVQIFFIKLFGYD